jgi:hypothetical protein
MNLALATHMTAASNHTVIFVAYWREVTLLNWSHDSRNHSSEADIQATGCFYGTQG